VAQGLASARLAPQLIPHPDGGSPVTRSSQLARTKQIGAGLAFVVFPLVFIFAFSVHPGLLTPHLADPAELVQRALHNPALQFGHALVTLNTALLVVVALHFTKRLEPTSGAWLGLAGGPWPSSERSC
jgi:hypothetical protein